LDTMLFDELPARSRQVTGHHRRRCGQQQTEAGEYLQAIQSSRAHWAGTIQIPAPHKVNAGLRRSLEYPYLLLQSRLQDYSAVPQPNCFVLEAENAGFASVEFTPDFGALVYTFAAVPEPSTGGVLFPVVK